MGDFFAFRYGGAILKGPSADGTAGQFLQTDGSGNTSFATVNTDITGTTAAAPSPAADGDSDTGLFSPAPDVLAFAAGGVEGLRMTESGGGVTVLIDQQDSATVPFELAMHPDLEQFVGTDVFRITHPTKGNMITINGAGHQKWKLYDGGDNYRGAIQYQTPSGVPGIRISESNGDTVEVLGRIGSVVLGTSANRVVSADPGNNASSEMRLAVFNATPVAQQATTGTTTGFTAGSGTAVNDDSTFTGGSGTKAYTVGDIVRALKNYGLLAAS